MKPLIPITACALALAAAACGAGPPKTRAALDCPQTEGALTRKAAAPDGKSCTYAAAGGAEVTLQLIALEGGPDATLAGVETRLLAEAPAAATPPDTKAAEPAEAPEPSKKPADAKAAGAQVRIEIGGDRDPGTVTSDEDVTRVDLPGIHIEADDTSESASVRIGPLHVDTGDGSATIRVRRDVRLMGEQLSPEKRGLRATFIRRTEERLVGYEAAGPKAGPLTVATVKAGRDLDRSDSVYGDIRRLVRRNGGV